MQSTCRLNWTVGHDAVTSSRAFTSNKLFKNESKFCLSHQIHNNLPRISSAQRRNTALEAKKNITRVLQDSENTCTRHWAHSSSNCYIQPIRLARRSSAWMRGAAQDEWPASRRSTRSFSYIVSIGSVYTVPTVYIYLRAFSSPLVYIYIYAPGSKVYYTTPMAAAAARSAALTLSREGVSKARNLRLLMLQQWRGWNAYARVEGGYFFGGMRICITTCRFIYTCAIYLPEERQCSCFKLRALLRSAVQCTCDSRRP